MVTLKPQSNGPSYSSTVIGTLAVDGWDVTFGTAMRGLGGLWPRPVPSSLYQMQQPTHQRSVYQLHMIRSGTVTASEFHRVNSCPVGMQGCTWIAGSTLVKYGQTQQKLGQAKRDLMQATTNNFLLQLKTFLDTDVKAIQVRRQFHTVYVNGCVRPVWFCAVSKQTRSSAVADRLHSASYC